MSNPYDPSQQPGQPGYGGYPQQQPPGYGYPPPGYGGPTPPYASWLQRVGGALIDGLIVGVPAAILYGIGFAVGSKDMDCTTTQGDYSYSTECSGGLSGGGVALILLGALVAFLGSLYFIYMEGTTGQTPGKKVVGIKLIREADGQVIGFGMSFVRRLCHVVDSLPCYLGWFWPIWDAKKQTFADKIISTIVVKV
ncbi:RDD family protein [Nocardia yamanashiensis]|uniref:RDD family protein n=1 Tax=Nocardia yamanashiensis TaxID=209247 RepID=UPI00082CAE86|nr:RDD family protein [Nocardia yamanashiensis]